MVTFAGPLPGSLGTGATTPASASTGQTGGVALQIYNALRAAGLSTIQAAGVMGNMMAESSLDPEAAAVDSNGKMSYGLVQWNTGSYTGASGLVTGNVSTDIKNQVAFLAQTGGFAAATGSTPAQVASNFAHSYERCAACGYNQGSGQLTVRSNNADKVAAAIASGNWLGISSSTETSGATTQNPTGTSGAGCNSKGNLFTFPGSSIPIVGSLAPSFTYCEAKAWLGGLCIVGGGILMLGGIILLARGPIMTAAATAAKATPAGKPAQTVAKTTQRAAGPSSPSKAVKPAKTPPAKVSAPRGYQNQGGPETDPGDELFARRKQASEGNRKAYKKAMDKRDTSDLKRRTA